MEWDEDGGDLRHEPVIVVDDHAENRALLVEYLQTLGFTLEEAEDGRQGIAIAIEFQPDVILVDLMMPEVNGIETTKKIRLNGFNGPIIAFTALDDADVHIEAKQAGCNEVVTKPYKGKKLLELVNKWIEN